MPKKETEVTIAAVVPVELRDEIRQLAEQNDRSFSAELRQALRHYLDSMKEFA